MTDQPSGVPSIEAPLPARERRWLQRSLWVAGPLVVLLIGGWLWVTSGRYVDTDNAYVGADLANIAPQVGGLVMAVEVRQDQPVHKGDVLFRIDPLPYELSVAQLQAQSESVGNLLASSRDSYTAARANLRSQDASLHNELVQLARVHDLQKKGLVSQKELDDAANEVDTTRGDRDAAAANAARAKSMFGGDVDAPLEDLAGYKVIKAQLAKARLELEYTTVHAPFDGIIGKTSVQPGDFLQAGEPAMPLIAEHAWVDANFKETDLTLVRVGQLATITLDTYPDYTWHARVQSISPASGATFSLLPAQNATGNWVKVVQRIPVRLEFTDNPNAPAARVGMSADVRIDTGANNSIWGRWFGGHSQDPLSAR